MLTLSAQNNKISIIVKGGSRSFCDDKDKDKDKDMHY